jgi:hypothetical protein
MLAIFNVASLPGAPNGAMKNSVYVFGSLNGNGLTGLNGARGTYVNPSNFAARDAAVFDNGANIPVSLRSNGESPLSTVGFANQQLVTAESVGANTSAFLTSISTLPVGQSVQPCACTTQWGFWSAFNGATNNNGQLTFEDQGVLLLWVAGTQSLAGTLPVTGMATYTGHAIASIASSANPGATSYLAAGALSATANFATRTGTVSITGLDGTNYAGTAAQAAGAPATFAGSLNAVSGITGRTATLAGSFFQGTGSTPAYSEIGGSLILNGTGNYLGSGIFLGRKP